MTLAYVPAPAAPAPQVEVAATCPRRGSRDCFPELAEPHLTANRGSDRFDVTTTDAAFGQLVRVFDVEKHTAVRTIHVNVQGSAWDTLREYANVDDAIVAVIVAYLRDEATCEAMLARRLG
jgi:hypothetical protein